MNMVPDNGRHLGLPIVVVAALKAGGGQPIQPPGILKSILEALGSILQAFDRRRNIVEVA
jgi:hypothetical protein